MHSHTLRGEAVHHCNTRKSQASYLLQAAYTFICLFSINLAFSIRLFLILMSTAHSKCWVGGEVKWELHLVHDNCTNS